MTLAFYYDDSQYRYAASPANAVQCLRSNTAQDSIYNLWGGGNSVNLVHSTPAAGSGALLMMGRTEELVRALHLVGHAVSAKVSSIKLRIKHMFGNNAHRTCVEGILLPHNESRLRLVTYPCHWTKDREADVVAYIRIGKVAWAVDFR